MGPKSGWGGEIGYVRPVQFLDHLTVIKRFAYSHRLLSTDAVSNVFHDVIPTKTKHAPAA